MKMNLKRWKFGLLVSLISGLLTGLVGLAIEMSWRQILLFVIISVAKDGQLYLMKHPPDEVSFDTELKSNEQVTITKKDTE